MLLKEMEKLQASEMVLARYVSISKEPIVIPVRIFVPLKNGNLMIDHVMNKHQIYLK